MSYGSSCLLLIVCRLPFVSFEKLLKRVKKRLLQARSPSNNYCLRRCTARVRVTSYCIRYSKNIENGLRTTCTTNCMNERGKDGFGIMSWNICKQEAGLGAGGLAYVQEAG